MRTIKTCTVGVAGLLLTSLGATAVAQEKADELAEFDSMMLEEIVVTARRREESAQTVPVSITAITADDLIARSALVLSDVAKETPSLTIQSRQGDQNTQIVQLRGQVQTDAAATLDPSVGVYLNDIYVSRNNGANFELFDVERVEILSGPQGTLYGRNTTGGAIKLITRQADLKGEMNGYATVGAGNFNGRRIEGAVNLPISDSFAMRVAGLSSTRDGYGTARVGTLADPVQVDGATPFTVNKVVDTDDKNTTAGRISALYEPTEKLTLSMVTDYAKQVTNGTTAYDQGETALAAPPLPMTDPNFVFKPFGNYTKCSTDFYTACQNFEPEADVKTFGTALTAAYDTSIGTAKVIYGYRSTDGFYKSDLEGTPLSLENLTVPTKTRQNTLEAQLQGQTAKLDYTVGLFYFKETGDEIFNDVGALTLGTRTFNAEVDNESKSIYGQTGYNLTRTVRLTTGLRYTEDSKGIVNRVVLQPGDIFFPTGLCLFSGSGTFGENGLGTDPAAENCQFKNKKTFGHLSWTVGLDWQPTDGILTYIKASDGYRSGGQNVRGIDAATSQPFNEETIQDIEVGLKSRLADRVRLNLTYYHSKYSDIQTTIFLIFPFPQNTTTTVINQGTATIDGVEAQSIIVATDNLSFDLSGSYTNVDYALPDVIPQLTPKFKGSIGANLFFPTGFGDWNARLSYAYQGKFSNGNSQTIADSFPETVSGSRGLIDARVALNIKQYDLNVALYGTNLTDKEYPEVVTPFIAPNELQDGSPFIIGGGPFIDVFNRIQVGKPRMFGLELTKRF